MNTRAIGELKISWENSLLILLANCPPSELFSQLRWLRGNTIGRMVEAGVAAEDAMPLYNDWLHAAKVEYQARIAAL